MAMKAHMFVGAKRAVYLPDWIRVDIRIVSHERVRSWQRCTWQTKSTFHDTANPRTKAEGEYSWLLGGRQGGSVGGYQFIFDDGLLIQTGVLNEVSWHAGTPLGNQSFGAEHAFGGGGDYNRSLEIGMALHGGLMEMMDLDPDEAAVLHQYWTGKWCSAQILNRGLWLQVKAGIKRYAQLARAARDNVAVVLPPPGETVVYAKPHPVLLPDGTAWDGSKDLTIGGVTFEGQRVKATTTVNLRRREWGSVASRETGPIIPAGTDVELLGWVAGELVDGISEWWIGTSGSRLWAGGFDVEPKQVASYGERPEAVPGLVLVNGRAYYPLHDEDTGALGRKITVKQPGNLRKWAGTGTDPVGTVSPGEELVFKYWTIGEAVPLFDGTEEPIWYAEDVHTGARMWAGLSDERPD